MLQTSFPAEIGDFITGLIVYLSGLTNLAVILVNKYLAKRKEKQQALTLAGGEGGSLITNENVVKEETSNSESDEESNLESKDESVSLNNLEENNEEGGYK